MFSLKQTQAILTAL
ncbi:MAG: hypothetical protein PWP74_2170, partial [Shewanella sp.]|nr:hypothetical protein [Shewanella sp.]